MKKTLLVSMVMIVHYMASSQMVAKMEIKDSISGLCNSKEVYALLPMFGDQVAPVNPVADEEVLARLNGISFLKANPQFKDKGMVSLIINCKGEVVKCEMDNKTKDPELDKQVVEVFNSLGTWKPGKLNGKNVDAVKLWSFTVKKGKISFGN